MTEQIVSRWKAPAAEKTKMKPSFALQRLKQEAKKARKESRSKILSEMTESLQSRNSGLSNASISESFSQDGTLQPHEEALLCFEEALKCCEGFEPGSFPWLSAWLGFDSRYSKIELNAGAISLETAKQFFKARAKIWHPDVLPQNVKLANEAMNNLKLAMDSFQKILK